MKLDGGRIIGFVSKITIPVIIVAPQALENIHAYGNKAEIVIEIPPITQQGKKSVNFYPLF